ncbi:putative NRPS-like protein biosynthetic cluster [Ascosphaera acerosa]|nr:putative NRPS-like protein biosynthetic cluster [Ascosphaera acerosa]
MFERTAHDYPDRWALESAIGRGTSGLHTRHWTYAEVEAESNKFARVILQATKSQGGLIAVCFDKCPEAYMALLGILKAGYAYVAIDPAAPAARKAFIVDDSDALLLMTTTASMTTPFWSSKVGVIIIDSPDLLTNVSSATPSLTTHISPEDTCYCLYTSGTTGLPKGCQITHKNAVQAMLAFQRLFRGHWDDHSRWLQFASFHFDVSVLEQFWSWSVGICLVSCPRDILFEDLPGVLARLRITHIDLTPSLARLVHPQDVPSLQRGVFITGGEALRQEILDDWSRFHVLYNGYGPTEVTIGCTMYPRVPSNGKPSNIGMQFDNVSAYVFAPGTVKPVLRGGIGELCVGGQLVGKGYLKRDDLTVQRFLQLDQFQDRVYRTGDLVRQYYDGTFEFLGRQDDQVKLRGQRLEIGEINEVIRRSAPAIAGVATLLATHAQHAKAQLVSFLEITTTEAVQNDASLLLDDNARSILGLARRACVSQLPGYMIPTHFIPLTKVPLTANNKADNQQLLSIYTAMPTETLQAIATLPKAGTEPVDAGLHDFASLVAQMLNLETAAVTPESNLYHLGIDSVSAVTFAQDLRAHGFHRCSVSVALKCKTFAPLFCQLPLTSV